MGVADGAEEGVERREPSYTIHGNVSWCSHYGEQYEEGSESCSVVSDSLQSYGLYSPWNSPLQKGSSQPRD